MSFYLVPIDEKKHLCYAIYFIPIIRKKKKISRKTHSNLNKKPVLYHKSQIKLFCFNFKNLVHRVVLNDCVVCAISNIKAKRLSIFLWKHNVIAPTVNKTKNFILTSICRFYVVVHFFKIILFFNIFSIVQCVLKILFVKCLKLYKHAQRRKTRPTYILFQPHFFFQV